MRTDNKGATNNVGLLSLKRGYYRDGVPLLRSKFLDVSFIYTRAKLLTFRAQSEEFGVRHARSTSSYFWPAPP